MKRTIRKLFIAGIALAGALIPAGIAYAQAYGAGNYSGCTYGNNCPLASGLLPNTGSLVLILSGLGVLILAAVLFVFLSRRRKRRRSMQATSGTISNLPTAPVLPNASPSPTSTSPSQQAQPPDSNQPPPPPVPPTPPTQ